MNDMVLYALLAIPLICAELIVLYILFLAIEDVWNWIDKKLHPRYPFCDIDPRCHIAFAWDKDGNGWIGDHLVVPSKPLEN